MRARFVLFAALSLVSALAACGGGGGGGGGNPPTTSPTATATATATPTTSPSYNPFGCDATSSSARRMAVGVQPTAAGATYSYTGTLTSTIVRSSPCPVGTATANATVSIGVTMSNGGNTETDTESDAHSTNTDEYSTVATVGSATVSGATVLEESAETTTDLLNSGTSTTTTYGLSPLVYAILSPVPFTSHGGTIDNDPPSEVKTKLADGSTEDRIYSDASGAYNETDTPTTGGGSANTLSVTDAGLATYDVQTPALAEVNGVSQVNLSFTPSGSSITVSASFPGSSVATPAPITITKWWTQSQLYSDQFGDLGTKNIPATCSTANDFSATNAEEYEHTTTNVDPALGSLDVRTVDEYVVQNYDNSGDAVGPVCVVINDNESLFYDLFLDTPQLLYVSEDGKPFQTNTIAEAYWFSAAATNYTRVRADSTSPGVSGLAANVGAHVAGIAFRRSVERAQRLETTLSNLRTYGAKHAISIKTIKGAL